MIEIVHCRQYPPQSDGIYFAINDKGFLGLVRYKEGKWYAFGAYKKKTVWIFFDKWEKCSQDELFIKQIDAIDFYWIKESND